MPLARVIANFFYQSADLLQPQRRACTRKSFLLLTQQRAWQRAAHVCDKLLLGGGEYFTNEV